MTIVIECENGHKLRVNDSAVGKKVRCPKCAAVVMVQKADVTTDPDEFDEPDVTSAKESASKKTPVRSSKAKSKKPVSQSGNAFLMTAVIGVGILFLIIGVFAVSLMQKSSSSPSPSLKEVSEPELHAPPAKTHEASPENKQTKSNQAIGDPKPQSITPIQKLDSAPLAQSEEKEPAQPINAVTESLPSTTKLAADIEVDQSGMIVWDTGASDPPAKRRPSLTTRDPSWVRIRPEVISTHVFTGDCVVENGKIWLQIPRDSTDVLKIAAKEKDEPETVLPFEIDGPASKTDEPRIFEITELTSNSAVINLKTSGGEPLAACRVSQDKYWIEVIPAANTNQLKIETQAKFVVVPTEFGEDQICDAEAAVSGNLFSIPVPHENMVILLEKEGNHMSLLTYPSITQAGELQLSSDGAQVDKERVSNAIARNVSAKFQGHSVFVCLLPQKNLWYSEVVSKKYSAPGHYPIKGKSLYPGMWRIAGRIVGKTGPQYYVSDFPDTNLLFECRQSGTMQCLFYFLSRSLEGSAGAVPTPLDIYRETVGVNEANAYLLQTEVSGILFHRPTRHRGLCGCVDEMKDTWVTKPQSLVSDPNNYSELLADCRTIMDHMDMRLHEYERMTQHLGSVIEQINSSDLEKADAAKSGSASSIRGLRLIRTSYKSLKATKVVPIEKAKAMIDEVEEKIRSASTRKFNLRNVDEEIEKVRDVANKQEDQLKKYRGLFLEISSAASLLRETASEPLKQQVTAIGQDCRKMLRTRGRAE